MFIIQNSGVNWHNKSKAFTYLEMLKLCRFLQGVFSASPNLIYYHVITLAKGARF